MKKTPRNISRVMRWLTWLVTFSLAQIILSIICLVILGQDLNLMAFFDDMVFLFFATSLIGSCCYKAFHLEVSRERRMDIVILCVYFILVGAVTFTIVTLSHRGLLGANISVSQDVVCAEQVLLSCFALYMAWRAENDFS